MTAETDRELLLAAARAAGMVVLPHDRPWRDEDKGWFYNEHGAGGMHSNERPAHWNPLTDDGDALRLAVKLRMTLRVEDYGATARIEGKPRGAWNGCEAHMHGGIEAATRRAIVRAAAAISNSL